MCLLGSVHRLLACDFSAQKLRRLPVAERSQWPRAGAIFFDQDLRFLDQTDFEHLSRAPIDPLIKGSAIWIEPQPQNPKSLQRIASLLPQFGHSLFRRQTYFNGPNQLRGIVRMNLSGGLSIKARKNSVEILGAALCYSLSETILRAAPASTGRCRQPRSAADGAP